MTQFSYEDLFQKFITWAADQDHIRAAFLVGSRARTFPPADEFSDADIIVLTAQPDFFLKRTDWLDEIQTHWITFLEPTVKEGLTERRVLFDPGLDVDFIPVAAESFPELLQDPLFISVLGRGFRPLLDKDQLLPDSLTEEHSPVQQTRFPTEEEWLNFTHDWWYHAVWAMKRLLRGELWTAKSSIDSGLKWALLQALEWHAKAVHGPGYDTWYKGRFVEKWADPRFVAQLRNAYAHYNQDDLHRALVATMELFRSVTTELADKLNLPYPAVADEQATRLVRELKKRLSHA